MAQQLIPAIADSLRSRWHDLMLSDFQGVTYTGAEVAAGIEKIHIILRRAGVKPGDKVALCARNSAAWAVTFLGALTYGATVVPLLHEFHPDNIEHLLCHAEATVLFTEKSIFEKLSDDRLAGLKAAVLIPDLTPALCRDSRLAETLRDLDRIYHENYPGGLTANHLTYTSPKPESLALINYTSGSTGNSKGVMLTYANLWSNVRFGLKKIDFLHPGDGMLSMLPLAHMYGLVFEFLFPFCRGCHITFLGRVPSPAVVLKAFAQVKPKLVITVPLVIEKIVRANVFPRLRTPAMKVLTAIPGVRTIIYRKVRAQLIKAFGGKLQQLILGGAAMSSDVESFLRRIRFPFTVGYGMTECAPLVTYEWWATQRPHSCGRLVDGMKARVDSPDPVNTPGVLHVKGSNVMMGYYKNPDATAEALSPDGWLNTGDICTIDPDGYVYLRGRNKSMILGPSGQNIYPEEIESELNNLPLVAESVVVDRDGKIVALVHPDYEAARLQHLSEADTDTRVKELLPELNRRLPAYSRVSSIEIQHEPFEKTPKHSIRRFLYK